MLVNEHQEAEYYEVEFTGQMKDEKPESLASGVYLYRLKVNDFTSVKKMPLR